MLGMSTIHGAPSVGGHETQLHPGHAKCSMPTRDMLSIRVCMATWASADLPMHPLVERQIGRSIGLIEVVRESLHVSLEHLLYVVANIVSDRIASTSMAIENAHEEALRIAPE